MSAFVDTHRDRFGVEPICREIEASASAYRARRVRPPSARSMRDEYLLGEIERVHDGSDGVYGQLKICALCRCRHKIHYADVRIMPTPGRRALSVAVPVLMRSA